MLSEFDLPSLAVRKQIAEAVDIIIQQTLLKDGSRKITRITKVVGIDSDEILLQDLFLFKEKSTTDGRGNLRGVSWFRSM
ncbi:hypothetical protein CR194_15350 [Salipaludibacillus keqinensis]|uniref:Uncharacterized protein n=1 Tax=Salipaludibacillus keqinensis TaxID=2045207 RepID=A0A323TS31_9BACI|nr:hypothetical protein [Salipaludibacillus keqinensis]PYZ92215.1 hypothetical protein CR194_15350 [Salipaludibacillus keqinensis]